MRFYDFGLRKRRINEYDSECGAIFRVIEVVLYFIIY